MRDTVAEKELKRVRSAARRLDEGRVRLGDAMLAAAKSGESVRTIARWADMSTTTTQRILDEARDRERRSAGGGHSDAPDTGQPSP